MRMIDQEYEVGLREKKTVIIFIINYMKLFYTSFVHMMKHVPEQIWPSDENPCTLPLDYLARLPHSRGC